MPIGDPLGMSYPNRFGFVSFVNIVSFCQSCQFLFVCEFVMSVVMFCVQSSLCLGLDVQSVVRYAECN